MTRPAIAETKVQHVDLPWPARDLHPNARCHWARKARATKAARTSAAWSAKAAGIQPVEARALNVTVIFNPPNNRAHDVDGLVSSCKPYFDGLADVIGVDDRHWQITPRKEAVRPLGNVRIEMEVLA